MSEYLRTTYDKFELLVRKGFYYTNDDLWVSIENGQAKIGVSDYLQKTSGDIAFIEVAKAGSTVEKGKELGTVESAKTTIALLCPISGRVDKTNDELAARPELINSDPYGKGWLAIIAPSNLNDDQRALVSADDYYKLMLGKLQTEHEKLESR
ncbi:MAG: glycine cleavage system protein H [Candidatus Bathyarchaeia archaeon]